MVAHDIIIKPILSEKSYADIANKKYYFKVAKKATKKLLFNFQVIVSQSNSSTVCLNLGKEKGKYGN